MSYTDITGTHLNISNDLSFYSSTATETLKVLVSETVRFKESWYWKNKILSEEVSVWGSKNLRKFTSDVVSDWGS